MTIIVKLDELINEIAALEQEFVIVTLSNISTSNSTNITNSNSIVLYYISDSSNICFKSFLSMFQNIVAHKKIHSS